MRSTMMDRPLLISRLLDHGSTVHGRTELVTWTGESGARTSYAQIGREAARLAHALRDLGIDGDQRVATFGWNNRWHTAAYFAVPGMGAVLHTLNVRLFPDQLAYIANHAEDRVVIVDDTLLPALARVLPELKTVQHVIVHGSGDGPADTSAVHAAGVSVHDYASLLDGRPDSFDWPELDERDVAALCYTSGTTGNPKGVAYSHRSIWLHSMEVCMGEAFDLDARTELLVVVPMFHAMAWGTPYAAFMSGAALLMPDRFLQPAPLVRMIEAERPTKSAAVPTIWADVLRHLDAKGGDVSSLQEVIIGGSACPPSLMRAFHERYGIEVVHAWGMTEMSPLGTVSRTPSHVDDVHSEDAWTYRETQGRLPAGVEARIVGPSGDPAAWDGETVGELEVRGPWVAASYVGGDDDPEKFRDGWLRTGDVGVLSDDGFLTLTDRAKDVIKSGGEWISSVELENHLMAHPAVAEAAVVGVPDDRWDERPLACVVVADGASVTPAELRDFLADRVARWQLPERWTFIDAVPRTSVGKFDKKVLRTNYAAGDLDVTDLSSR